MSTISPDVIDSINENLYELSGAWLWSSEDVYSQDYLEVYGTGPISLEAVTLAQVRWKAEQADIIVRSGPSLTDPVVFACTAMIWPVLPRGCRWPARSGLRQATRMR